MINFTNMTNWAQIPEAANTESGGLFGIIFVIIMFAIPLSILIYRSRPEDATSLSLFIAVIGGGILVSLSALNPVAIPVLLALLALSIGYSFLPK